MICFIPPMDCGWRHLDEPIPHMHHALVLDVQVHRMRLAVAAPGLQQFRGSVFVHLLTPDSLSLSVPACILLLTSHHSSLRPESGMAEIANLDNVRVSRAKAKH